MKLVKIKNEPSISKDRLNPDLLHRVLFKNDRILLMIIGIIQYIHMFKHEVTFGLYIVVPLFTMLLILILDSSASFWLLTSRSGSGLSPISAFSTIISEGVSSNFSNYFFILWFFIFFHLFILVYPFSLLHQKLNRF